MWMKTFMRGDLVRLASSRATVSNLAAVRDVIGRYKTSFEVRLVRGKVRGRGTVRIGPDDGWPRAGNLERLYKVADKRGLDLDDGDEGLERFWNLVAEFGDEDFTDLLLEIAPYLLTPLSVQALAYDHGDSEIRSKVWHVAPGADRVEVNAFGGAG
jgi:hypothetical protein